jgi:hypothetical protein
MRDGLAQQTSNKLAWRTRPKRALLWIAPGGILTGITLVLSAFNAVSRQQSIALALQAAVLTIGGLIGAAVPDAWTAWRRGSKL